MTLRTKVMLLIDLCCCSIIVLSFGITTAISVKDRRNELVTQTQWVASTLAQGLARSVWEQNTEAILGMIHAIAQDPYFANAQVLDQDHQVLAKLAAPEADQDTIVAAIPILYTRGGTDITIGMLRLERSWAPLRRQIRHQILSLVIALAATCIAVTGAVYAVFRLISRPLERITAVANGLGEGRHDSSVPEQHRTDEIGDIARAVELSRRQMAIIEQLRIDQNRYLELVYEGAVDALLVSSQDGAIELCNPAAQRIFGWTTEELRHRPVGDLLPELARHQGGDSCAFESFGAEMLGRHRDGGMIHVAVSINAFTLGNDRKHSCIIHDISEHMAAQAALIAARQAAEDANETKSAFLANMSHEIRTPMNAIIGLSHLALTTEMTRRQRDYLDKINNSAKALLGILNDILDMSKIEAGKLDIEAVEFRLDDVLRHVSTALEAKVEEKGLELIFALEPNLPSHLVGDSLRLGQVLLNLCSNAVKFTEKGEIKIQAELAQDLGDKVKLQFAVTDSGIGMTEEQTKRMFVPFSQADISTSRRFGGTGLGLSISKRLVEMMDGDIGVRSVYGTGTTFWFHVILERAVEQKRPPQIGREALMGLRILVVDDSATARSILRRYLTDFGCYVTEAADGMEALDASAAAHLPFQVALVDMRMPGMNGLETADALRRQAPGTPPLTILVSAYGRDEIGVSHEQRPPVAAFLAKPVLESTLRETMLTVLGQARNAGDDGHRQTMAGPPNFHGARVLLVEDNDINQMVARELLEGAGIQVEIAGNGRLGVDRALAGDFDVILMDVQMPVLDGYAATRELRGHARFADVPIIAMTANAMSDDHKNAMDAGMNDHISKPIDVDAMFAVLSRWLNPATTPIPPKVPPPETVVEQEGRAQPAAANLRGARVLLVEDNEINQMVARELLEGAGIQVEIADNGRNGVDLALVGDFDVVLMDVQMPIMDGYAASREIRSHPEFADLPIIAMTANAMSGDTQKARDAGMNDHISKPIDVDHMFAVLTRWLGPGADVQSL